MLALFESGRLAEACKDAAKLRVRLPQITAIRIANVVADEAIELRERTLAAARGCGIP
jgi:hypothetical protein